VIFFDVGGTLLHFNVEPSQMFSRIVAGQGIDVPPDALYRAMREVEASAPDLSGMGAKSEVDYWRAYDATILRRVGTEPTPALLDEVARRFREELTFELYPESVEVLQAIKDRGIPLGVISNASHGIVGDLERTGVASFFEHIVYSQQVGCVKPDPRIFREALGRFAVEAGHTWHVGDNVVADVGGAKAVGIRPLLVRRKGQETPPGADVVDDLRGVLRLLP
jgi:putative hydrolase of the HAD superfamily